MNHSLRVSLALTALAATLAALLGQWVPAGYAWLLLCLVLAGQLLFHLHYLARLENWAKAPYADQDLQGRGAWDGVFRRLYRHEKNRDGQLAALKADLSRLFVAAQVLHDGLVLLDEWQQIVFCNRTAERLLGLDLTRDRGLPVVNLLRQEALARYLKAGDFALPVTLRLERDDERLLALQILPAGRLQVLQVRDITQSDRLERMRRDFVANVSHELRTPLTVLRGFLESLQDLQIEPDEQQRYLRLMSEQSQRMESIVQDLLTLSTLEAAPPPIDTLIDMPALLDRLLRDARALSGGRQQIELGACCTLGLRGDENELLGAFANLLSNAVRYTPEGGRITLSWQAVDGGAELAVQDTGIGIEAEHLPRLTERFYRVDRGRSRQAGGTGLGLAIVKHSLSRHQAQLRIDSRLGEGSRFAAHFPVKRLAQIRN